MAKLEEQTRALTEYFRRGCKNKAPLTLGVEVEHFITHQDGAPAEFAEVQAVMQAMQKADDETITIDGLYMGYQTPLYVISLEPACQMEISIMPRTTVGEIMSIYEMYFTRLCAALAEADLRAYAIGFHPTRRAETLPLIPKERYRVMDRYFQKSGGHGIYMMRATASTQVSIDYFSEADFVQKYRVASLIAPLLALLTDNAPVYQAQPNHAYSVRTHIWNDVDPERCGVIPCLMDEDFGFASYARYLLQKPQIVVRHGQQTKGVGRRTAVETYGNRLSKNEIEQILSMFFFDVRLKSYIEIRVADSLAPRYIAAYVLLIKTIFSSQAAQEGILRHYADADVKAIEAAKLGVCSNGYKARVYGHPVAEELVWLLAQAKSRIPTLEERLILEPFVHLVDDKKTIWEEK